MPYGTVKVDNVTFTNNSVDATTTFSGIYASITNNLTLSGTATATTFTGTTANFTNVNAQNIGVTTSLSGLAITGGTAGFTTVTGTTVTGTTANFVTVSGTTTTGTTANFASGVFTTQVSGTTVIAPTGTFTSLTGTTATFTSGIIASGTAALPSLAILSDPNTGIFSPGADQLAISTNGTGRLFVDASGNVRIASGSTWATGNGAFQLGFDSNDAYATTYFDAHSITVGAGTTYKNRIRISGTGADNNITFHVGASSPNEVMRLDGLGRLGLGTSSPQATLHATGAILSSGALVALSASNIFFDQPTSALSRISAVGANTSTAGTLTISQYSSNGSVGRDVVHINSSGNVGIGTTSPGAKLEVSTGSSDIYENIRLYNRSSSNHTRWGINCNHGDDTKADVGIFKGLSLSDNTSNAVIVGGGEASSGECGLSSISFVTTATPGTAETASERARIDGSGRLLVGTTSAFVEGFNNALTASQLSKGSGSGVRCISDTRTVAAVNNSTVDVWVGRTAAGNAYNAAMAGHFYVTVGGANCFTGVYSIVTTSLGTSSATLTAVSTVTRSTSPVSSVQIAADGLTGAIKLTITYINNAGVVNGLESYVSFVGLAA